MKNENICVINVWFSVYELDANVADSFMVKTLNMKYMLKNLDDSFEKRKKNIEKNRKLSK